MSRHQINKMKLLTTVLLACLFSFVSQGQVSIYSFEVDEISKTKKINFSGYQGKKILIVNTDSKDTSFSQYSELMQLFHLYRESLVIIVFPSSSSDLNLSADQTDTVAYNQISPFKFPVAAKTNVAGPVIHPLYQWLTNKLENGVANSHIDKPCYKYLIDKNGKLVAFFHPIIRPMNSIIRSAIER